MTDPGIEIQQLFKEGAELLQAGNAEGALACFMAARFIEPANAILCLYAGASLHELSRYEEAIVLYRHALLTSPHMGEVYNNLGNSLMALGRFVEAADCFSKAVVLIPGSPVPLAAQATALQAIGKVAEAEQACRRALEIDPEFAAAHWNLSLNLLLQGRYEEGWKEYEWRWQKPDFTSPVRHADIPLWDGSALHGRSILLHAEQGFGDAIQFARYVPLVAQMGGYVVLECHPQLVPLFKEVEGVQVVVPFGLTPQPFSYQAPLLSLPRIVGTTLKSIPSQSPYVSVPATYRNKWAGLIPVRAARFLVGLVWGGKSYPDPLRSCRLGEFAPLAAMNDIVFYSIQLGPGSEQTAAPPSGMTLIDQTDQIADFADTAALIERLDLVISIDTAVAHLAGALGKPTLIMLPFAPDWRWLLDRNDSPWYQSVKIYRQKQPGDWSDAIIQIGKEVARTCEITKNL